MTSGGMRLATRGSRLALAQAALAVERLSAAGIDGLETVIIRTQGDERSGTPVERLEGDGWFSAALELALSEGRADGAVHSAKDLPSGLAAGLGVAAFLERADCRDALVTRDGRGLGELRSGASIGTSSARRAAFLQVLHPELRVVPIRGNVDTRLRRLEDGDVDGLLLACAGLDRLGAAAQISERLDPRIFVPAPCQGAIAIETRYQGEAATLCAAADHPQTRVAAAAERAVLAALGGGCLLPLGAWARFDGARLVLTAALESGGELRRVELSGHATSPQELGERVAARLR
ncbi:MAG: hydroxymethylbilane synthase [Candidatus Dormibacteria bacterium]